MALAVGRPFGFTVMFAAFAWAKVSTGVIRMAFAVALSLPALASGSWNSPPDLSMLPMPFMAVLARELAIGAALGFLASVPLAIAVGAGGIVDYYRGSFQGQPDPAGGEAPPTAMLMGVTSLWIFANAGGLWTVAGIINGSYALWPVQSMIPAPQGGADVVLMVVEKVMAGALILAAPVLLLLFVSDIAHLVSSKLGKNINITQMAFSSKALLAAVLMPLFMLLAARAMRTQMEWFETVPDLMRGVLQ